MSSKLFTLASLELWCRMNVDEVQLAQPEGVEHVLEEATGRVPASLGGA